jgi:hypothetical protein
MFLESSVFATISVCRLTDSPSDERRANIREETQNILAVSRGNQIEVTVSTVPKVFGGKDIIDEQTGSWNDDVMMDLNTNGEFHGSAERWAKFDMLRPKGCVGL